MSRADVRAVMPIKGRAKTTDRITPAGRKFFAQMDELKDKPHVKVGVIQKKFARPKRGPGKTPYTIGQVAVVNEFGTEDGHVPERSFLRSTHEDKKNDIYNWLKKNKIAVVSGRMTAKRALSIVGARMQAFVQEKIISLNDPPNAPSTIARKKSSNPLIAEGQLLRTIGWEYHGSD